jgi:2-amino-4-hydroxy-6-hydroxymethyldihydropteridine diphosphokinase
MSTGIYLLLGTNLGDRKANLLTAKQYISSQVGSIVTESGIYKTDAWGNTQQAAFYNQVLEIHSNLSPPMALSILLDIERTMGRVRTEKWGARIIDIDILFWEDEVIKTESLTIPHPGIPHRKFTLVPLSEIAPELIHPEHKVSITRMLETCADSLTVEKISLD